jgi:hypothetical protein
MQNCVLFSVWFRQVSLSCWTKACHVSHRAGEACHVSHIAGEACHVSHIAGEACHVSHIAGSIG